MDKYTLSLVVPSFNEARTIESCVERILSRLPNIGVEIIIVDDASTDGSYEIIKNLAENQPYIKIFRHEKNRGKGARGLSTRRVISWECRTRTPSTTPPII